MQSDGQAGRSAMLPRSKALMSSFKSLICMRISAPSSMSATERRRLKVSTRISSESMSVLLAIASLIEVKGLWALSLKLCEL